MARLAQKSNGNTYFVESGFDHPGIFSFVQLDIIIEKAKICLGIYINKYFEEQFFYE